MSTPISDRFAAIDIGTNSVLLTVAEGPELRVVHQVSTVTRLGQDVDKARKLHPEAMKRTLDCLRAYRTLLDEFSPRATRAVGTSALRDAQGGSAFLADALEILGFEVEVISGMTEANLTFSGALHGLSLTGPAFVFDIGGGSTELILGDADTGEVHFATSLDIGSVRLTERLGLSDPPTHEQLLALRSTIGQALEAGPRDLPETLTVVGVAGTVTTLCAISQQLKEYSSEKVHGHQMQASTVYQWADRLAKLTVAERLRLPGLTPGRADVIGAGAALCAALVDYSGQTRMTVSDRGVRFGLLRALANA